MKRSVVVPNPESRAPLPELLVPRARNVWIPALLRRVSEAWRARTARECTIGLARREKKLRTVTHLTTLDTCFALWTRECRANAMKRSAHADANVRQRMLDKEILAETFAPW